VIASLQVEVKKRGSGLVKTKRVSRSSPCPICGHPDWCLVSADGSYAVCMRVPSPLPARSASGGWVHTLGSRQRNPGCARPVSPLRAEQIAGVERLHKVYEALLKRLRLSERHRRELGERGMSDTAIRRNAYASLLVRGRAAVCRELASRFDLTGIPGFCLERADGGSWWTIAGRPGLLIPVRDVEGKIVALRIRPDDPVDGKYRWFSSGEREGGTACAAHCHVARPLGFVADSRLYITEGEIKADIAAQCLGAVVVSVPGVGLWRAGVETVRALAQKGSVVVAAYDLDSRTNPFVAAHEADLLAALHKGGYSVHRALWPVPHKGIDDALVAGASVVTRPVNVIGRVVRRRPWTRWKALQRIPEERQ